MKLIRSLGTLTERQPMSWLQRMLAAWSRNPVPMQFNGDIQSTVLMQPALFGKVLRTNPALLASEQLAKLRELLKQNVDVGQLASAFRADVVELGCLSRRTVTDNGVTRLAEAFAGNFTLSNFKFHAFGTGTTAEAETHANLVTELTTQYNPDSTRPTGSQANNAAAGGPPAVATYVTVGTLTPDSGGTIAVTEHGLFASAAGVGGGANTMWDRSVFSAVNLVAGSDSLQVTYTLSLTANG